MKGERKHTAKHTTNLQESSATKTRHYLFKSFNNLIRESGVFCAIAYYFAWHRVLILVFGAKFYNMNKMNEKV